MYRGTRNQTNVITTTMPRTTLTHSVALAPTVSASLYIHCIRAQEGKNNTRKISSFVMDRYPPYSTSNSMESNIDYFLNQILKVWCAISRVTRVKSTPQLRF